MMEIVHNTVLVLSSVHNEDRYNTQWRLFYDIVFVVLYSMTTMEIVNDTILAASNTIRWRSFRVSRYCSYSYRRTETVLVALAISYDGDC